MNRDLFLKLFVCTFQAQLCANACLVNEAQCFLYIFISE